MIMDMDLYLDIVDLTGKEYDIAKVDDGRERVMVLDLENMIEDLVEVAKNE